MKQVHWQLPFASLNGTQYRIDIYAEGAPTDGVKTLVGAATPFTTDEDNSDDFFEPVRSQTGCINIIDEDGTLMDSGIMPSDNVDKPVRLIRVSDGAVMWQGFLNCETYSQEYTSRPNEVTLNVNSVMEAMESVKIEVEDSGFFTIGELMNRVFKSINEKADIGTTLVSRYSVPQNDVAIMDKFIDTTVMFDLKQQDNENQTIYESVGIGLQEVIVRICQYMGWVARELAKSVYICNGKDTTLVDYNWSTYYNDFRQSGDTPIQPAEMRNFAYKGTGHEIETRQGAKSVEVVAKIGGYEIDMKVPECPVDNLSDRQSVGAHTHREFGNDIYITLYGNNVEGPYKNTKYNYYQCEMWHIYMSNRPGHGSIRDSSLSNLLNLCLGRDIDAALDMYHTDVQAGACLCKYAIEKEWMSTPKLNNGLLCCFLPAIPFDSSKLPIFSFTSQMKTTLRNGYIIINADMFFIGAERWGDEGVYIFGLDSDNHFNTHIKLMMKVGDMYWDGSAWTATQTTFDIKISGSSFESNWDPEMKLPKTDGYIIPVEAEMEGVVEFGIMHYMDFDVQEGDYDLISEILFKSLSIDYTPANDPTRSDRSENHYYRLLDTNFSEEVSVTTEIASDLNNKPSPTIIMNNENEEMTTLYYADSTIERPEKVLLARLAEYYSQVRRKISLEVDRPTTPLPLVRVTGYDGKTYLPLSESRDWKADTSTITCFETPE